MKTWLLKQQKRIKKWRRRIKAARFMGKVFKFLVAVANIAITCWELYDKFLKERLQQNQEKTAS